MKLPHISPVCPSKPLPESARGKGPILQEISGSSSQKTASARTPWCVLECNPGNGSVEKCVVKKGEKP